jgi:hypothetical protein
MTRSCGPATVAARLGAPAHGVPTSSPREAGPGRSSSKSRLRKCAGAQPPLAPSRTSAGPCSRGGAPPSTRSPRLRSRAIRGYMNSSPPRKWGRPRPSPQHPRAICLLNRGRHVRWHRAQPAVRNLNGRCSNEFDHPSSEPTHPTRRFPLRCWCCAAPPPLRGWVRLQQQLHLPT